MVIVAAYVAYIVFKLRFYCQIYNATHYFYISNTFNMPDTFVKNNLSVVISFVVAVFTAGGIFAEFTALKDEIHLVHDRLDEKIITIDRLETRLLEIEKKLEYERGFLDAADKNN